MVIFFFFQAEDGIRDDLVTGVQTCALPIYASRERLEQWVSRWIGEGDFLALGAVIVDDGGGSGLDDQCLLVDVSRYHDLGCPAFGDSCARTDSVAGWNFVETSLRNGLPVRDIGPVLDERRLSLGRLSPPEAQRLGDYLGSGIRDYAGAETWLDP